MEQARKAFGGFIGAVTEAMEGDTAQAAVISTSALSLSRLAVDFADRNVRGAFELAHKMVHASDLSEVVRLQRDFLETQMRTLRSQMRTLDKGDTQANAARESRRKAG